VATSTKPHGIHLRNRKEHIAVIERLNQKRTEEGFTLIELLIVILVLGILAAIVVFAVGGAQSSSVGASCKTDAKSIELSLEAQNTSGTPGYPATGTPNWQHAVQLPNGDATNALLKNWPGGTNAATDNYVFVYNGTGAPASYSVSVSGIHVVGGNPAFTNLNDTTIAAACAGK
jgi:general secretion pathway protein G